MEKYKKKSKIEQSIEYKECTPKPCNSILNSIIIPELEMRAKSNVRKSGNKTFSFTDT